MKKKITLLKVFMTLCLFLVGIGNAWGEGSTWKRVTTIKELTDGGTFIMGYEATAKSGVIVPLRSADCNAKTTANGYFNTGTTAGSSTNGTIDMSKVTETADYEVYITSPASGKINIQMKDKDGSYYGGTSGGSTKNSGRLYTSGNSDETNLKPEFSSEKDNQFKLTSDVTGQYKYLKYNTGSPRFAYYNSAGSNIVFYKKESNVSVTGVSLNTNTLSLNVGATGNLTATIAPDNATNKNVTWSSNQESVATVSESGVVTAVAAGTATITVTTQDGNKTASCEVTVTLNKLSTPTNLQATPTSTSATLTWDAVANASKYEVNINNKTLTAETNSLLVGELTASTAYTWTVKAIGDNITYADSEESAESNFTTLAPPSVAYTVSFDGNGHGTPATTEITETEPGAGVTLPDCTPNEGYQFVGWATSETATEAEYEAGATYYPTENITLFAVYNEVYTITWSVNGTPTTDGNPTTSVKEGEGITTLPTTPADISGMKFQGWTATQIATSSATAPTDLFTDAEHAPAITANTTFYAVFAEESEGASKYVKVTTAPADWCGKYLIVYETGNVAFDGSLATLDAESNTKAVTISNNVIASSADMDAIAFTVAYKTGSSSTVYSLKSASGKYISGTTTTAKANNGLKQDNTDANYEISFNGTTIESKSSDQQMQLKYNKSDGQTRFRFYKSGQESVALYKKTQDITYTYYTNVVVKELTSIELSGDYPTEFWKGGTFSYEGMTVTAHYSNADDEDVTSKATFTGYDMTTAGEQTVTVTYDTKSTTYNITVKSIANTQETAYTVTEAKAIIDANPAELATTNVYVKGTVSKVDKIESGAITYWLDENAFEVYKGKNINGEAFTSVNDIAAGDEVVICGKIKKYSSTYEFDAGNYLVSHVKASTLSIDNITVSLGGEITPVITTNVPETGRTIEYSVASEDVVKVQDGKLVTVAVGGPVTVTATLTAEGYKDATTTFDVEVIPVLTSIAVKTAPTTVSYKEGDKFNPAGLVITANYNDETSEDITYSDETKESFTFEPSLETPLTTENTSVTIKYAGKETTQEITVRALYTYDITWKANGEEFTTTQVTEGSALVLPETTPESIGEYVFRGWTATEIYYHAEEAPEYITTETIPTENTTYYAVFAKAEEGEGEVSLTINKDTENFPTSYGTSKTFEDKILNGYTFAIMQAYINGEKLQWRAAGNTNGTGTMYNKDALNKIQSVKLTYHEDDANKNFTVKVGADANPTEGTLITPSSSENVYTFDCSNIEPNYFVLTNGSGAGYLAEIAITYIGKTTTFSNYTTTVTTATMAIGTAKWATFIAPFDVEIPEDIKAYTVTIEGEQINYTEVENNTIEACTPVVVFKDVTEREDFTFIGANKATEDTYQVGNLVGTLKVLPQGQVPTEVDGAPVYLLQNHEGKVGFYKTIVGETYTMQANRAYLIGNATIAGKAFFSIDGSDTTGINEIYNSRDNMKREGIFDLSGRKLTAPQKGINIINGVRVLIK